MFFSAVKLSIVIEVQVVSLKSVGTVEVHVLLLVLQMEQSVTRSTLIDRIQWISSLFRSVYSIYVNRKKNVVSPRGHYGSRHKINNRLFSLVCFTLQMTHDDLFRERFLSQQTFLCLAVFFVSLSLFFCFSHDWSRFSSLSENYKAVIFV